MKRIIFKSAGKDTPPIPVPLAVPRGKHRGQTLGAFGNRRRNNQLVAKPIEARRIS